MEKKSRNSIVFVLGLIALASASRLIPHPPNATAMGAVALFAGFAMRNKLMALLVLFASLFLSDLLLNNIVYAEFTDGFMWFTGGFSLIFAGFALSIFIGQSMQKRFTVSHFGLSSVLSVVAFFLLTNFGSWLGNPMYTQSFSGLMTSYVAGLPFALNQLLYTVLYGVLLFGAYSLYTKRYPQLA